MELLIVCGGGASSSFIAQNVQKEGVARGLDITVDAISETELEDYAEGRAAVLAGPHLRYLEDNLREITEEYGVPFDFIADTDYSTMNGKNILDQALALANKE
ncbi:MAG: PTS sugar transporter subunit IIB [Erysipelotrichaceae bacterium]|nr:PTS sugar transporter subunit IIB [Erysipelotrichaceae bacterium]